MKTRLPLLHLSLLFLLSLIFDCSAQKRRQGDWIILKEPRTDLLGRQVSKLIKQVDNSYELNILDGTSQTSEGGYGSRNGVAEKLEIEKYYKNLYTKYFEREKNLLVKVKTKNVKIYDLSLTGFDKIGYNKNVVVSGVGADSVIVSISAKKESNINVSTITKDILNKVLLASMELPDALRALMKTDTSSIQKKDSLIFNYKIIDNKTIYKVKVAKASLVNPKMRTDYGKLFWSDKEISSIALSAINPTSPKQYAEWWGPGSDVGGEAWLRYDASTGKLFAHYEGIVTEIPPTTDGFWDKKHYVTTENKRNISKMIIFVVYAVREIDERQGINRLRIYQTRDGRMATYLHYPEFIYKWL